MTRVVFSARAARQIEAAERWCKEEGGPPIREALTWLVELIADNPYMGAPAQNARRPGLRRFYLARTDHHVYYRVDARRGTITVTAFRHARRRPIRM